MTYYYSHLVLYIDIIYGIYTSIHYDILLLTFGAIYRYFMTYYYSISTIYRYYI